MSENQKNWKQARDRLVDALVSLGHSEELGDLAARHLGSPRAIDRMTSYVLGVKPRSAEMVVDEMLAIRSEVDAWKEKKASERANAAYNWWLACGRPEEDEE